MYIFSLVIFLLEPVTISCIYSIYFLYYFIHSDYCRVWAGELEKYQIFVIISAEESNYIIKILNKFNIRWGLKMKHLFLMYF